MIDALVIAGPTACGKTALALALAQHHDIEIINMDSALVYRQMNIGTAKPSLIEQQHIVHHLIDIKDITEAYSAAEFIADAECLVTDIRQRGRLPVVVGGTLLYLDSWMKGLSELPSADPELRATLLTQWQTDPVALHQRLCELDPVSGRRIHPNDPQRIMRAIEVFMLTGQPMSALHDQRKPTRHRLGVAFIMPPSKEWLHQRIAQRFHAMLANGFVDEVQTLFEQPLDPALPALRSVGYRQIWQYLSHELSYDQMCEQALQATRQLAKRQLTWMKKMHPDVTILAQETIEDQQDCIEKWLF